MMAFWNRWFRREVSRLEPTEPSANDRELVKQWVQSIDGSLIGIRQELQKIPSRTAATVNESFEGKSIDMLSRLDALPEKIIGPLGEIIDLSKREILAELVRISSQSDAHH